MVAAPRLPAPAASAYLRLGLRNLKVDQENIVASQVSERLIQVVATDQSAGLRRADKAGLAVLDDYAGDARPAGLPIAGPDRRLRLRSAKPPASQPQRRRRPRSRLGGRLRRPAGAPSLPDSAPCRRAIASPALRAPPDWALPSRAHQRRYHIRAPLRRRFAPLQVYLNLDMTASHTL